MALRWELDLWYEMWDRAGSQGLDTWYELPDEKRARAGPDAHPSPGGLDAQAVRPEPTEGGPE